ncbi:phosphoribosyltransferase [Pseudanabaena sp. PCC 6802]|uniref:phosphoribosyltransferase n=1 Tax=Pseudanabaena sp. PCC 6802 TaxID=118173 RepID=UPI00034521FF|nr:phosphoribosyltransferase [Pseudanabaena sp. PCC 6802]
MTTRFRDRTEAGRLLAPHLAMYANRPDAIVLALPRGGVPVAFEVAKALHVPLDICLVRKLGIPGHQELAMGAIAMHGIQVLNHSIIKKLGVDRATIERVTASEKQELARRDRLYRGDRPFPDLHGQTVILIDDGIATGATIRAAIQAIQASHPHQIVVATPVAPASTCKELNEVCDRVVCLMQPEPLYSISNWYDDFSQTTDAEVKYLLAQSTRELEGEI